jgi:membrane protease YdiL (CAAX protease family)
MATTQAQPASARQGLLARRPLVFYFLIAFAFTWALLFSVLLSKDGLGLLPYGVSPAMARLIAPASLLGPSVAALIVTGATEGWAGIGRLLRRIVRWRVGLRWYLFVLLGLPAVMVLGTFLRPGALASFDVSALPSALAYFGAFAFMVVLGGPLFEEPGWRGFALPRLQRLHGPLIGGPHPGEPVGAVAPARVLGPAKATAVRHGHGLREVLLGPHRPCLHHTVGLQQHGGQRAYGHPDPRHVEHLLQRGHRRGLPRPRRRRQLHEPHHSRLGVGAGYHSCDARAAGLPG